MVAKARRGENLHQLLARWWQFTAQVGLAVPEAFDLWWLVRTQPRVALPAEPLLGAFAGASALVHEALVGSPWYAKKHVLASVPLTSLAAQWTAPVDVVRRDPARRADPTLTVCAHASRAGLGQSLGLSTSLRTGLGSRHRASPTQSPSPKHRSGHSCCKRS